MNAQEKQQNVSEEQLEMVTGGMNPEQDRPNGLEKVKRFLNNPSPGMRHELRIDILNRYITKIPPSSREPLHPIAEEPTLEKAHQTGWISENPNKRRRMF